jgi:hypothetical protein
MMSPSAREVCSATEPMFPGAFPGGLAMRVDQLEPSRRFVLRAVFHPTDNRIHTVTIDGVARVLWTERRVSLDSRSPCPASVRAHLLWMTV